MKAVVMNSYGDHASLEWKEIAKPRVAPGKVLVKVKASSINAGDHFSLRGSPFLARFFVGFPRPRDFVLGWDLAGTVEDLGPGVEGLGPGDEVYAAASSAFAEYALVDAGLLARKPAGLSFEEAAALPTAALTALQALRDGGKLAAGERVLINGASGGVGTCAVQIAKSMGAEVTAVCGARNQALVLSLGADRAIDYRREDFVDLGPRFDLILDNVASRSLRELRKALAPGGLILPNSGFGGMRYVFKVGIAGLFDRRIAPMRTAKTGKADLDIIRDLVERAALKPVIDAVYPLEKVREAFKRYAEDHPRGKLVFAVA